MPPESWSFAPEQSDAIVAAYRDGLKVSAIAARFGRGQKTVYRVLRERRAVARRCEPVLPLRDPITPYRCGACGGQFRIDLRRAPQGCPLCALPPDERLAYHAQFLADQEAR